MRFERLNLQRYGHFSGFELEFGAPSNKGDFHLIYGPNEAGKSTLRDACIDFLFGFERITPYSFKHPNPTLLIEAEISANGEKIEAQRIKRDTDSFRSLSGEPISESGLKAVLGDVSRANYLQMFSLDEDTLVEGGNEILKSQGDLGALLFSAASGLSSISEALDNVQQDAEAFFKPSGRKFRLNAYKETLKQLKEQLREIDLQASVYDRLRKQTASAKTMHDDAKAIRLKQQSRLQVLSALMQASEVFRQYSRVLEQLKPLENAPDVAHGIRNEAEKLVQDFAAGESKLNEMRQSLKRLLEACEEIEPDQVILENAAAIGRLGEGDMEARYQTSSDIEHRQKEIEAADNEIGVLLRKLGQENCAEPRSLLLNVAVRGNLVELIEQQSKIQVDLENATRELGKARDKQADLQKQCDQFSNLQDLSGASDLLETFKTVADEGVRNSQKAYLEDLRQECDEAVSNLTPWKGAIESLQSLVLPQAQLFQQLSVELEKLQAKSQQQDVEISRLELEIAGQSAMRESLQSASGLMDDEKAKLIRQARDRAWADHIGEFENGQPPSTEQLQESAKAFEVRMKEDDEASLLRLAQSTELASLKQVQVELAKNSARLRVGQEQKKALLSKIEKISHRVAEIMTGLGLPASTGLSFLSGWLEKRETVLRQSGKLAKVEAEFEGFENQRLIARKNLLEQMQEAGIIEAGSEDQNDNSQGLIARCKLAVDDWNNQKRLRGLAAKAHLDAKADLRQRERQHALLIEAENAWQVQWAAALEGSWMAGIKPVEAKHMFQVMDDLEVQFSSIDKLQARIAAMELNRATYIAEVNRLIQEVGVDDDTRKQEPLQIADQLRFQLARAEEGQRRLQEQLDLVEAQKLRLQQAEDRFNVIKKRQQALCAEIGVETQSELLAQLKRGEEKKMLLMQAGQLGENLRKLLDADNLDVALEMVRGHCEPPSKLAELEQEHASLKQDEAAEQENVMQLYHQWKEAERQLAAVGDDGEAAQLEEVRQVLLLQIEQEAHAYMRLMAGRLMVGEALRVYRDKHRSAMMQRASQAFVQITRENFKGLTSAPGKNGDILVGTRSDGSSIEANQMSRGTRFQLYLALRIAGHAEFAKSRETLPFFADDILEPFDDDRSAETFKLLAEMSKLGQVVYLTHHQHLCQIAKDVCGEALQIHTLPGAKLVV